MKKTIYCQKCSMEIKDSSSLVISSLLFLPVAYHDSCYSKSAKRWQTAFVGNQPINGSSGTINAIVAFVASIVLFFIGGPTVFLGIFFLILPIMRVFAWLMIEKYLE